MVVIMIMEGTTMKNNELNKNILRAISIGLAATLTLMPTVTAFADDGEDGGDSSSSSSESSSHESHESESTEKSRDASDSAREAAEADHHEEEHHEEEHHEEEHHEEEHHEESSNEQSNDGSGDSYVEPQGGASDESTGGVDPGTVSTDPAVSMMVSSIGPDAVPGVAELQIVSGVSGETDATIELVNTTAVDAQTAAGITDPSVATLMNGVADTMEKIATKSKGVDDAVDYADGLIEEYEETAEGASRQINATGLATSYAEGNINKANEIINDATNTANDIKNAADGTYVTDEEKAAANETLESALNASNEAVGLAESNLNTAAEALGYAEKAVQDAEADKKKADEAVKQAREKFINLLEYSGIEYKEEGNEIITDGNLSKAIQDAENALLQAQARANELNKRYDQACLDADAAISNASAACDRLISLKENHADILDNIANRSQSINSWAKARTLAYYMAEYYLVQIGELDADTTISVNISDGVVQNDSNEKGFTVTLKNADGTEKGTYKFNYRAISSDGKISDLAANDPNKLKNESTIDHIQLMLGDADKTYSKDTDWKDVEAIAGFENSASVVDDVQYIRNLSSEDLNNQKDVINGIKGVAQKVTTDASLDEAKQNLTDANEKLAAVEEAIQKAKEILNPDENNYVTSDSEGKISFNDNTLFDTISEKQKNMEDAIQSGNKSDIVTKCRDLAVTLVRYQLEKEGYTDIVYMDWNLGDGTSNSHFGWYQYKDSEGNIQNRYFDYVALSDESSTENILDIKNVSEDTLKTISTIKVISKTVEEVDGVRKVVNLTKDENKAEKCGAIILESEFKSDSENYRSAQQQYRQYKLLESARSYAQSIVDKAQVIYDKKGADFLEKKVEDAKNKVDAAAEALKNAKLKQSVNQEYIKTLKQNLEKAQKEYDTAKENLDKAKENRDELEKLVNEAKSVVASQKKVTNNSHHKSHKSDDTVEAEVAAPSVDTVMITAEAPNLAAPAAGDTASVITLTDTTFAAPEEAVVPTEAVFTAAPGVESAVLGDTAAPETTGTGALVTDGDTAADEDLSSDVLGERMAPIVDAVKNGNFSRAMLFNEEAKGIPMGWWLLFFVLGATGVGIYVNYKKRRS